MGPTSTPKKSTNNAPKKTPPVQTAVDEVLNDLAKTADLNVRAFSPLSVPEEQFAAKGANFPALAHSLAARRSPHERTLHIIAELKTMITAAKRAELFEVELDAQQRKHLKDLIESTSDGLESSAHKAYQYLCSL
ncbi:MAG: hypothetical protein KDD42_06565 [Bdellovibrionales bacterium]|nr:hypothetical protein [Bdellovibrionales bacterium]